MLALVKATPGPGLVLVEVPEPVIGINDVLIRVRKAGICGTDLHIYKWDKWAAGRIRPPLVFGHEFCGDVVEVGELVTTIDVETFVSVEGHIPDRTCFQCRTGNSHICENVEIVGIDRAGCFADYVAVPEWSVYTLDRSIPLEMAAILDPFGNAVHTALAGPLTALSVAVVGAGPIGCCAIAVARAAGARFIVATDVRPFRLDLAKKMGADLAIDSSREDAVDAVKKATGGQGVDVVLEMSGHPDAVQQGFRMVRRGGRISLLGIPSQPVPLDLAEDVIFKGVTVQGINGRRIWETWHQAEALLRSGKVDLRPLITHTLPLDKIEDGMRLLESGNAAKIILKP